MIGGLVGRASALIPPVARVRALARVDTAWAFDSSNVRDGNGVIFEQRVIVPIGSTSTRKQLVAHGCSHDYAGVGACCENRNIPRARVQQGCAKLVISLREPNDAGQTVPCEKHICVC